MEILPIQRAEYYLILLNLDPMDAAFVITNQKWACVTKQNVGSYLSRQVVYVIRFFPVDI